jgi:hypothetical protein
LQPAAEVATIDGDNHMLPLRSPNALGQLTADSCGGNRTPPDFPPLPIQPRPQRLRCQSRKSTGGYRDAFHGTVCHTWNGQWD